MEVIDFLEKIKNLKKKNLALYYNTLSKRINKQITQNFFEGYEWWVS